MKDKTCKHAVVIECKSGTKRLISNTQGTFWEDNYHIITWCTKKSREAAELKILTLLKDNPNIKRAWVELTT